MGPKPKRYQHQRCLHFITFSCYRRMKLFNTAAARDIFEHELERVRRWYGFYVTGYVVMPEHVHLLISEPERAELSLVIQMLKQITSHKLKLVGAPRFWQVRYYDFPVWSQRKRVEKLRYIHRNPVKRGLVARPEDWQWSSFLHWAIGREGKIQIECPSTARRRERMGMPLTAKRIPPVAPTARATSVGQPAPFARGWALLGWHLVGSRVEEGFSPANASSSPLSSRAQHEQGCSQRRKPWVGVQQRRKPQQGERN